MDTKLTPEQGKAIKSLISANKRLNKHGLYLQDIHSVVTICRNTEQGFEQIIPVN